MKAWRSAVSGLVLCGVLSLAAFGCSSDDDDSKSTGTGGSGNTGNTGGSDASSGGSGGASTGGTSGASSGGTAGIASGGSAGHTGDAATDSGCDYLDLDILLVDCNAQHLYLRHWTSLSGDPNCPEYWTLEGQTSQFPSQGAALQSSNCNENCVRHATTSVSLLKCGVKTGYIVYHAENCPDVLETPDGFFSSVEEWNEKVPCP